MTEPITSRGPVTLWLDAVATTPKVYLHLAGNFSRCAPSFGIATVDEPRRIPNQCSKERASGAIRHALSFLTIMHLIQSISPPDACRCNLKHEMWRNHQAVPNEIRGTSDTTCHALLGCSGGLRWGPKSRKRGRVKTRGISLFRIWE